jgi:hypothetical protein
MPLLDLRHNASMPSRRLPPIDSSQTRLSHTSLDAVRRISHRPSIGIACSLSGSDACQTIPVLLFHSQLHHRALVKVDVAAFDPPDPDLLCIIIDALVEQHCSGHIDVLEEVRGHFDLSADDCSRTIKRTLDAVWSACFDDAVDDLAFEGTKDDHSELDFARMSVPQSGPHATNRLTVDVRITRTIAGHAIRRLEDVVETYAESDFLEDLAPWSDPQPSSCLLQPTLLAYFSLSLSSMTSWFFM